MYNKAKEKGAGIYMYTLQYIRYKRYVVKQQWLQTLISCTFLEFQTAWWLARCMNL